MDISAYQSQLMKNARELLGIDSPSGFTQAAAAFLSGFAALAVGGTLEDGQKAIDEHLSGGGTLDELIAELNKAVEESGFFKHAAAETKSD